MEPHIDYITRSDVWSIIGKVTPFILAIAGWILNGQSNIKKSISSSKKSLEDKIDKDIEDVEKKMEVNAKESREGRKAIYERIAEGVEKDSDNLAQVMKDINGLGTKVNNIVLEKTVEEKVAAKLAHEGEKRMPQ